MDDLIARALAGDATDLEKQRLRHWLEADAENARLFARTAAAWKSFDALTGRPSGPAPSVADIVRKAERRRRWPRRRALLAAAALVTVAASGAFYTWGVRGRSGEQARPASTPSLAAVASTPGAGGVSTLTLSDGSVVRLAAGARVDFLSEPGRRAVALQGRAFFAVAPGTEPFTVRTPTGSALALGTRFEVATAPESARVVVVEGTVVLSGADGGSTSAAAGSVGTLPEAGSPRVEAAPDLWALLDWPDGLLLFQATPLVDVAEELERRFGVRVTLADSALAARRVTAWFGEEALEQVVEAVCTVAAVRCRVRPGSVVIGG